MSKKDQTSPALGPKAMEMVMRDVLGGMEELMVMKSLESHGNVFEILEIAPKNISDNSNRNTAKQTHNKAEVIALNPANKIHR